MPTILLNEEQAHNIYAAMHQARWVVLQLAEREGVPASWANVWLQANEELDSAMKELKSLLFEGARIDRDIPSILNNTRVSHGNGKVGRPPMSRAEKIEQITQIRDQIKASTKLDEKKALMKKLRRVERTLPPALKEAVRLSISR